MMEGEPIETELRAVFPKFDLGQWRKVGSYRYVTYATIERCGNLENRQLECTLAGWTVQSGIVRLITSKGEAKEYPVERSER